MSDSQPAIRPGLCSITFRKHSVEDVLRYAAEAKLEGVEWGGDVHVPPGDAAHAETVGQKTRDAGLEVSSYGSYFRCGDSEPQDPEPVLDVTEALGAKIVRVWAGPWLNLMMPGPWDRQAPPPDEYPDLWQRVADDLTTIARAASARGMKVALEHHPNTLTANADGAQQLLAMVGDRDPKARSSVGCYWQPNQAFASDAERRVDFAGVAGDLIHLHVFEWRTGADGKTQRLPLEADGPWLQWFIDAAGVPELSTPPGRFALLEFVRNDDPAQLAEDAASLRKLLSSSRQA